MNDLQVSPTAAAAESLTAAEVSTEAEMAGVAVPPTAANGKTVAAADGSMEAATAVEAVPSPVTEAVPPTNAEVFMEAVLVVDENKTMAGSTSAFDKDDKCMKAACCSCVGISRNLQLSASVLAKDLSDRIVADWDAGVID